MSTTSNIKSLDLDQAIKQQAEQITKIQKNIEKIIAANEILKESKDLQDKVNDFKRENQPTSKFQKLLRVYPTVKHWFIKSTAEKIEGKIAQNHDMIKEIDKTLVNMGKESAVLQKAIKEELAIGAYKLKQKLANGIISEIPQNVVTALQKLEISSAELQKAAVRVYNQYELWELDNQNQALNGVKSNINNLLNDNNNIPQLALLQKQLNAAQNTSHKSFGEHLKNTWQSITSVFKNSNKLQKNASETTKKLDAIDKDLEKTLNNIEKSLKRRKEKLNKELNNMSASKNYSYAQTGHIYTLLKDIDEPIQKLDKQFTDAINQVDQVVPHELQSEVKLSEPIYKNIINTTSPTSLFENDELIDSKSILTEEQVAQQKSNILTTSPVNAPPPPPQTDANEHKNVEATAFNAPPPPPQTDANEHKNVEATAFNAPPPPPPPPMPTSSTPNKAGETNQSPREELMKQIQQGFKLKPPPPITKTVLENQDISQAMHAALKRMRPLIELSDSEIGSSDSETDSAWGGVSTTNKNKKRNTKSVLDAKRSQRNPNLH